jgi:hypothetical protein
MQIFQTKSAAGFKRIYLMAGIVMLAVWFALPGLVSAVEPDIQSSTCQGANLKFPTGPPTGEECAFADSRPEEKLNQLVATIVNLFSVVVGVVAVLMIIVGGFRYITSGGDSSNVAGAKNTILYAIVGLVIVALAQFIVKFVLGKATGVGT